MTPEERALEDAALLADTPENYTIRVLTIFVGLVFIMLVATIIAMLTVKFLTFHSESNSVSDSP